MQVEPTQMWIWVQYFACGNTSPVFNHTDFCPVGIEHDNGHLVWEDQRENTANIWSKYASGILICLTNFLWVYTP